MDPHKVFLPTRNLDSNALNSVCVTEQAMHKRRDESSMLLIDDESSRVDELPKKCTHADSLDDLEESSEDDMPSYVDEEDFCAQLLARARQAGLPKDS